MTVLSLKAPISVTVIVFKSLIYHNLCVTVRIKTKKNKGQKLEYPHSIPYSTSIKLSEPVDHENTLFEKSRPL